MRQTLHRPAAARPVLSADYLAAVDRFTAQMAAGRAPWHLDWKQAGVQPALPLGVLGYPHNGVTVLLLWEATVAHGFVRPLWVTQRQCHAAGGRLLAHGCGTTGFFSDNGVVRPFTLYNIAQCVGIPPIEISRRVMRGPCPTIRDALTAELAQAFLAAGLGLAPRLLRRDCLPTWATDLRADPYRLFDAGEAAAHAAAERLARTAARLVDERRP